MVRGGRENLKRALVWSGSRFESLRLCGVGETFGRGGFENADLLWHLGVLWRFSRVVLA